MSARGDRAKLISEFAAVMGIRLSEARELMRGIAPHVPDERVYFITRGEPAPGVPVKVGVATDPWARMEALQTACPEELVMFLFVKGGRDLEQELHRRFAADHIRGEWFRLGKPIYEFALEQFGEGAKRPKRHVIGGKGLTPAQRRGREPLPDVLPSGVEVGL